MKREEYSSGEEEESSHNYDSFEDENQYPNFQSDENIDIIMTGNLIYRFSLDQIELEGFWSLNNDVTRERFSYLFLKKCDKITCPIKLSEIEQYEAEHSNNSKAGGNSISDVNEYKSNNTSCANNNMQKEILNANYIYKDEYHLCICSANLFEAITISHPVIFNCVTNYLTGEYHGFFVYYDKTIEDRFYINFDYDDNQVKINGIYLIFVFYCFN